LATKHKHILLLVDDEPSITKALKRLFRKEGYRILTADSGYSGLEVLQASDRPVSLIISDQRMPGMNGAEFLEKARAIHPDAVRFLLTGYSDMEAVIAAVNKGEIHRYLTKPWNDEDLLLQVRQALAQYDLVAENRRLTELTVRQNRELAELNKNLEKKVAERTQQIILQNKVLEKVNRKLEKSFMDSIRLLSTLVESLKPELGRIMRHVSQLARSVAGTFGLEQAELDRIEMAGMIHDIGLIGFPEQIWTKEVSRMNEEEFRLFSQHPVIASICLESVEKLVEVGEIVLFHHEYYDGSGFPNGLKGEQIPLGARIILPVSDYCRIVDTWPREINKLISKIRRHFDSSVWKSFTLDDDPEQVVEDAAQQMLLRGANHKYDLDVVNALIKKIREAKKVSPTCIIKTTELAPGMVLMEDLRLRDGRLLLTRTTRLKASAVDAIAKIATRGLLPDKIKVAIVDDGDNRQDEVSRDGP